jgi:hypothetical protein
MDLDLLWTPSCCWFRIECNRGVVLEERLTQFRGVVRSLCYETLLCCFVSFGFGGSEVNFFCGIAVTVNESRLAFYD